MPAAPTQAGAAQSAFGPYNDPPFILKWGPSGAGKSIDDAKAVHETAIFIAAPSGGITSITANLKFTPKSQTVETLDEAAAVLNGLIALGPYTGPNGQNPFRAAVFDDVSVLCKNQLLAEEAKGGGKSNQGKDDSRKLFLALSKKIQVLRYQLRKLRMFGLLNFHDKEPSVDALGNFHRGGPDLASVGQTESLIPIMDVCVRACMEMNRLPWVGVFECKAQTDAQRIYKDRYDVLPARGPLNTGELLRAAGFDMPYPLPWMGPMTASICAEVEEAAAAGKTNGANGNGAAVIGGAMPTALGGSAAVPGAAVRLQVFSKWFVHLLNQGVPEHLAQWVCQDGLDRAEIKMARRVEKLASFGIAKQADGTFGSVR